MPAVHVVNSLVWTSLVLRPMIVVFDLGTRLHVYSLSMCRKLVSYTCRKHTSYKSAGKFPTKCFLGTNLNATVSILNMCRKFSYKIQENFLHTSVKCCTSAGKFPAHTVKIWIFLSSAGNMIPALQAPNIGALSLRLSFLISFGTCSGYVKT